MKPAGSLLLAVLTLTLTTASGLAAEPQDSGIKKIDLLPPGPGNPRNSEGDFVTLADGRVMLIYTHFTGGAGDGANAHLASRVSGDGGRTWSQEDEIVIRNKGEATGNIMSVSLARLSDNRIAIFYLQKESRTDCRPVVRFSEDEAVSWSEPHPMIPDSDLGYYVMNNDRVVQLESGRLIAPLAQHAGEGIEGWDGNARILCYYSDDEARTWQRGAAAAISKDAPQGIALQEPGVVPLADGRLLIWCRTNAGFQYGAFSSDDGATWSEMKPLPLPSPMSPATLERIPGTEKILAVWNDHRKVPRGKRRLRTPLTLAISTKPAQHWRRVMVLEDNPHGWFCYTAMHFLDEAVLLGYCAGDRRENNGLAFTRVTRIPLSAILVGE